MTLVRVLIVAACLPLLLPTGFCLCKLGIAHHPESMLAGDSHPDSDDDHAPGCPGSHGADQLKWIEPLEFSILSEPPAELLMLLPLALESRAILPQDHEGPWPSAPPLFLTNCSFVI